MGRDLEKTFGQYFLEYCKEHGIPYEIIHIEETERSRQIEKDVHDYVMEIEEAHKKAAHSKITFGYSFA
jgi:hypothetical protein